MVTTMTAGTDLHLIIQFRGYNQVVDVHVDSGAVGVVASHRVDDMNTNALLRREAVLKSYDCPLSDTYVVLDPANSQMARS